MQEGAVQHVLLLWLGSLWVVILLIKVSYKMRTRSWYFKVDHPHDQ